MAGKTDNFLENRGYVKNVCKEFLLKNDETLAFKLQDKEYDEHYDHNRKTRRVVRNDIPVAKNIQNSEYQELLRRHEMLEKLEKDDEIIAREIQKKYLEEINKLHKLQQDADEEFARNLETIDNFDETDKNIINSNKDTKSDNDNIVKNMNRMNIKENFNMDENDEYLMKIQEQQDYEIAKYLQEQEENLIQTNQQQMLNKNDNNTSNLLRTATTNNEINRTKFIQKQDGKNVKLNKAASLYILNQSQQKQNFLKEYNKEFNGSKGKLQINNLQKQASSFIEQITPKTASDVKFKQKPKSNIESRKSMFEVHQWKLQPSSSSAAAAAAEFNQNNKNTKVIQNINSIVNNNFGSKSFVFNKKKELIKENERYVQTLNLKEKQFDLNILNVTDNILATIDPTFRRRFSLKDLNVNNKTKDKNYVHTISNINTLNLKSGYSLTLNTKLADDYKPVQGQRRTKTVALRKKSASQCLQQ